jgi:two-component system sensor histidine kinase PfeS
LRLRLRLREASAALLLDAGLQPLGSQALTLRQRERLTFMRQLDWPMSRRSSELPYIDIPFANVGGHLVIQLPERFRPWEYRQALLWLTRRDVGVTVLHVSLPGIDCPAGAFARSFP